MLNWERKDDAIYYTNGKGEPVGKITYTSQGLWLVVASEDYMHGTSTMWWKSLKAAEYHMLAIYEEKGE